ncbi:AAA domain-containing protein [Paenibacillus sp. CMAA1364]
MTRVNKEEQVAAKKKITQIFKYLQALDQLRNPVEKNVHDQLWTFWFKDMPNHSDIECRFLHQGTSKLIEDADDEYFTIRRPEITICPEPPTNLLLWIKPGWQNIENEPEIIEYKKVDIEEGMIEDFESDLERVQNLHNWSEDRSHWKEYETPVRQIMKVFERLYALYAWIERENEQVELMLGDGILDWKMSQGKNIMHPVILQKVRLIFDPNLPAFKLTPTDQPIEFYNALFRDVQEVSATSINKCTEDLEQRQCSPMDHQDTDDFLKRVTSQLSAKGLFYPYEVTDRISHEGERGTPILTRNPILFLRKRSYGFANAIDRIFDHLNESKYLPEAVTRITGIDLSRGVQAEDYDSPPLNVNGEHEDILFTKDANSEQLDIALKINKYGSVVVQGPPGTGKTHTIANLLGHFLAEGKKVLVTSHTSKALHVLRDKVVEPLRDLCVSVIDESGGQKQLGQSIDVITERLNSMSERAYNNEIQLLTNRRAELLDSIRGINRDIKLTRESEYTPIVFMGHEYLPIDAAHLVKKSEHLLPLIPGYIELGSALTLNQEEINELYQSNGVVSLTDEIEFKSLHIHPNQLTRVDEFKRWVTDYHILQDSIKDAHDSLWIDQADGTRGNIEQLLKEAIHSVAVISTNAAWKLEVLMAGKEGGTRALDWNELLEQVNVLLEYHKLAKSANYKYDLDLGGITDYQDLVATLKEIILSLQRGKRLNFINRLVNPNWDKTIQRLKVNGSLPSEIEHFQAILCIAEHRIMRKQLLSRWERQVSDIGGPSVDSLGIEPESILEQYKSEMESCLGWYSNVWSPTLLHLLENGLQWNTLSHLREPELRQYSELFHIKSLVETDLIHIVHSFSNKYDWDQVQSRLLHLSNTILEHSSGSAITKFLLEAVNQLHVENYVQALERIQSLLDRNEIIKRRHELLTELDVVAPVWATDIRKRSNIHGHSQPPSDLFDVWILKQLEGELNRRNHLQVDNLHSQLHMIREEFQCITIQLVEKRAWLALKGKTTLQQQHALHGWKLLMKKKGAGKGIRAPHLLAEARKLMPQCQSAVPVWIMPISRVAENFDPRFNQFDVVIVDEASQADVMALTALYLGKQVVVVGDDEQVSPEAIGQKHDEVQRIIDIYLNGIPNPALYDGQTSIFDLAKTSFSGMTQLREHFRSVEPIIQFSNALSYKGTILPLRDSSQVQTRPFTVDYRVEGIESRTKTNPIEALTIASLILAAIEQEEYQEKTIGVISLLGTDQAVLIDQHLQKYLPTTEYHKRKIRCGNSAQFQGDERDVIFLSMVHSSKGEGPLRRLADPGERMKKRYNVAASRARDQMWLIHSLTSSVDLKDGDLRKRLIDHFSDPTAASELFKQAEAKLESEFEKQVIVILLNEGYKVVPQWKVGAYRIDLVVEGGGKHLAIECDGDRWHGIEKISEDMARQAILERVGWTFVRIRGGEFFRNPDQAMKKVFEKLETMGIPRQIQRGTDGKEVGDDENELKNRVINRAAKIREEWENQKEDYTTLPKKKGREGEISQTKVDTPQVTITVNNEVTKPKKEPKKEAVMQLSFFDDSTLKGPGQVVDEAFNLCDFLKEKNISFIDKREKGGALWAIGDMKLNRVMKDLSKRGVIFQYVESGSQASKKKPAWFTKSAY